MRPDVERDFEFGRLYLRHLRAICGVLLIEEAPFEEDTQRATDLIVLRLDAIRVACRVRRARYLVDYAGQFTIRSRRPGGERTEMAKILWDGWGDYMIYGFEGTPTRLAAWTLLDLDVFRDWYWLYWRRWGRDPGVEKSNGDGSSYFRAFEITQLPAEAVIERHMAGSTPTPSRSGPPPTSTNGAEKERGT